MNLSLDLKKIANKQYHFTARERLLIIIGISLIVGAVLLYSTNSDVAVEPTAPTQNSPKQTVSTAVQVAPVNSTEQILRDPFAKPPESQEQRNNFSTNGSPLLANNVPGKMQGNVPAVPGGALKLTGIAGTADQRLAVISTGSKSRSYGLYETVGAYKLSAINNDSVVLKSASDKLVLRLEPTRQKGDNNSAK